MGSPGPTQSMLARQVRMGDVVFVGDQPLAVSFVYWEGELVRIALEDGGSLIANLDDPLDVVRPFDRHAETGPHDEV